MSSNRPSFFNLRDFVQNLHFELRRHKRDNSLPTLVIPTSGLGLGLYTPCLVCLLYLCFTLLSPAQVSEELLTTKLTEKQAFPTPTHESEGTRERSPGDSRHRDYGFHHEPTAKAVWSWTSHTNLTASQNLKGTEVEEVTLMDAEP